MQENLRKTLKTSQEIMGFDTSNIVTPFQIRVDNYHRTETRRLTQAEKIIQTMHFESFKVTSPSVLYLHFNKINGGKELYPITSIRARMTELAKDTSTKPAKLIYVGEVQSQLYDSTESSYKLKEFQDGLF